MIDDQSAKKRAFLEKVFFDISDDELIAELMSRKRLVSVHCKTICPEQASGVYPEEHQIEKTFTELGFEVAKKVNCGMKISGCKMEQVRGDDISISRYDRGRQYTAVLSFLVEKIR